MPGFDEAYGDNIPDTNNMKPEERKKLMNILSKRIKLWSNIDQKNFVCEVVHPLQGSCCCRDLNKNKFTGNDLKTHTKKILIQEAHGISCCSPTMTVLIALKYAG